MPKVGMHPIRRKQLIEATIAVIDRAGLADTTIARIAKEAGLSSGIISHYFGGKNGLIHATMRQMLFELGNAVARNRQTAAADPKAQIHAIIDGNFDASQVNRASTRVWLTFWAASLHNEDLQRLQRLNDRRLYSNLCYQFRRVMPVADARIAADAVAAMVDGLWLRGSLGRTGFDLDSARLTAYRYLDRLLEPNCAMPPTAS